MTTGRPGRRTLSGHALARLLGEWEATGGAAYEALAERIRVLLIDGRIPAQTWLPAERDLAEVLGRSRTTVISAYRLLRESGYLTSTRGAGSMATLPSAAGAAPTLADGGLVDFGKATPPMWPGLPDIYRDVAGSLSAEGMGSGLDLIGREALRVLIAARYEEQGLPTRPSQIMVTLGAQHAIALCARSLLTRGDRVVVESPTYPHASEALRDAGGGRLIAVGVTEAGWDVPGFEAALENARPALAYLMPDFHNPTGASMDGATREAVARAAAGAGTLLLIDETTRDLGIDSPAQHPPLAAAAPVDALTVTVGSLGKTVWGGLRLGWIRADEQVVSRLATTRASSDLGTPAVEQLVATELLPRLPEVIADRVEQLRTRRDLLGSLLPEAFPEWRVPMPAGGLSFWVGLGTPMSSALSLAARARDLLLTAGPRFGIDGAYERNVRIPFTAGPDELRSGVALLQDAWRSLPRMAEPVSPAAPVV
ncbi:PLP-dependent aminotransferase family protein [Naasia sp. SYSU D00948]|uniref:MocR-like transcription factor YczR n=1 Tax=Naasia sp. SYSU D00948 TaxID=2817379 RepID=UPI001B30E560|nr:PLP-dependent aminotransferase family protein [Naasia sp. SYSU D00948]